jgi:hypothetical protein
VRPTQQGGSDRQSDVAAADDSGGEGMKISPEQARANIVVAYERQLNEGISVLSSAMERVRVSQSRKSNRRSILSRHWLIWWWLEARNNV